MKDGTFFVLFAPLTWSHFDFSASFDTGLYILIVFWHIKLTRISQLGKDKSSLIIGVQYAYSVYNLFVKI